MPYPNVPRLFQTDPGPGKPKSKDTAGMSRYYVYADGIVRAKFQDGFLHIGYGKNIAYAAAEDIHRDAGDPYYFWVDQNAIRYSEAMNRNKGMQYAEAGKNTIDFFLNGDTYGSRFHHGHPIVPGAYAAKINGKAVDVDKLDARVTAIFGNPARGGMARIPGVPAQGQASALKPLAELGDIT